MASGRPAGTADFASAEREEPSVGEGHRSASFSASALVAADDGLPRLSCARVRVRIRQLHSAKCSVSKTALTSARSDERQPTSALTYTGMVYGRYLI